MKSMQNYKMTIAYDGRRYMGFKLIKEAEDKTIQGKLESILGRLYEEPVEVFSAIQTDASVHAQGQVVHFHAPQGDFSTGEIRAYFEKYLPDDIIVLEIAKADDRFHSRLQAETFTYQYRLWKKDARQRPLFERQYVNVMDAKLDISQMKKAAKLIEGEHDFTAFSSRSKIKNPIKNVTAIELIEDENEIRVKITAKGYLINMERIIVGTLIQIGTGQKKLADIEKAFTMKDPKFVGHKAMAAALSLMEVHYK